MKRIYFLVVVLFVLAGCDPVVLITAPEWGSEFDEGEEITFICTANDFEDGELTGDSLIWTSDIDGEIGKGSPFTTDVLTAGSHTITLTATDSDGNVNSDEIEITIGEESSSTTTISDTSTTTTTILSDNTTADYYVAPDGNDANPGTEDQPWQTIQKAADTLVAGETVFVKEGTYSEQVIPKNSGTAGSYIVYAAYPGDMPTIDGGDIKLSSDLDGLVYVAEKQYIKLSGLKIMNAGPNINNCGILVESSSNITIEKNYTYNTVSSGIGVWDCENIIIDGNEVELACNDGEQECITVAGTDTFEIRNNHVHHSGPGTIGGEGIDSKDGSINGKIYDNHVHDLNNRLGIYIDSWDKYTYNIEVYRNIVHDIKNADGFTIAAESGGLLENVRIYNNIVYSNELNGISISENGGRRYNHPMKDIYVINNTFYKNGRSNWGAAILVENPDAENVFIRNNICSQNVFAQIQVEATVKNLVIENNLIDGFRGYDTETYGDEYVEGDPEFSNAASTDFHLQAGSIAIDVGSAAGAPLEDYEGTTRPQGSGYDIGAFEFTGE